MPRRSSRSVRSAWRGRVTRRRVAKAALTALVAAPVAFLVIAVTLANVAGTRLPHVAEDWAPWDARVQAELAERALQGELDDANLDSIREQARSALRRDLTIIDGWRTLALLAFTGGDKVEALEFMTISDRLSRRDLPTQLWLIENSVARDDVETALHHYDSALRAEHEAARVLLPVLASATREDALVQPIAELVAQDPPWAPGFFDYLARLAPSGENAARLLEIVRREGYDKPIPNATTLPARLGRLGEYRAAQRAYELLQQGSVEIDQRDDQFAKSPKLPPFDWELAAESDIRAEPDFRRGGSEDASLSVFAADGEAGIVARRLFALQPGRYRLHYSYLAGEQTAPARAQWRVTCEGSTRTLLTADLAISKGGGGKAAPSFTIPGGCPAQRLELLVRGPDGYDPAQFWIEDLALRRAATVSPQD